MAKGWVRIHRQIQDCWIWQGEVFSKGQAWIDLVLSANHKDARISFDGEIITVQRGSFICSISALASKWKWSRHKVSDFLDLLEKDSMIEQSRDTKKTLITIIKYEDFQTDDDTPRTVEGHTPRTSKGHQKDTNKNDKNNITHLYISKDEQRADCYKRVENYLRGKDG